MAWHELLAWIIIAVAVTVAVIWLIRSIFCPKSACANCNKECILKRKN